MNRPLRGCGGHAQSVGIHFQIHTERKLTILLVTHDLPLVRKHAQQIIWLHRGGVLHGTVAELFSPNAWPKSSKWRLVDMETLRQILSPDFLLRNSVYTGVLIGFACPLVGVFLVLRRLIFMGVALPQISSTVWLWRFRCRCGWAWT